MGGFRIPVSVIGVAAAVTLLAGCASNDDVAQLRQEVTALRNQVQQSQQMASAAEAQARQAADSAAAAQTKADAARNHAEQVYNRSLRK